MRSKNGSNLKHLCLSKNEKRWQTKQAKNDKSPQWSEEPCLKSLEWVLTKMANVAKFANLARIHQRSGKIACR